MNELEINMEQKALNRKKRLSELDSVLLSLVTLLGLAFSVTQILLNPVDLLIFAALLIVGWVMPVISYAYRIIRNLSFENSLVRHFMSWMYFIFGMVSYVEIVVLTTSTVSYNTLPNLLAGLVLLVCPILLVSLILKETAIAFFRSFGRRTPLGLVDISFRGLLVSLLFYFMSVAISFVYLGVSLDISKAISGGLILFAIGAIIWLDWEKVISRNKILILLTLLVIIAVLFLLA